MYLSEKEIGGKRHRSHARAMMIPDHDQRQDRRFGQPTHNDGLQARGSLAPQRPRHRSSPSTWSRKAYLRSEPPEIECHQSRTPHAGRPTVSQHCQFNLQLSNGCGRSPSAAALSMQQCILFMHFLFLLRFSDDFIFVLVFRLYQIDWRFLLICG